MTSSPKKILYQLLFCEIEKISEGSEWFFGIKHGILAL